jgi:aspartate/methionine/tyrosine aminotransferase
VAAALTKRTRAICVVDPVNPYGTVLDADAVAALQELCERRAILLIDDVTHGLLAIDPASELRPAAGEAAVVTFSVSHCFGMAGARLGFLAGPPALMRACLQLKAALTRLNTNPISQAGALAALRDDEYITHAEAVVRRNLAHLEDTLADARLEGVRLAVRPRRGLACALDVAASGTTAQELMVALFDRGVAVYPGDGLGEVAAASTVRLNLSNPDPGAMEKLRAVLPGAVAEAASGRWREPVAALLESKGTDRARRLAARVRGGAGR